MMTYFEYNKTSTFITDYSFSFISDIQIHIYLILKTIRIVTAKNRLSNHILLCRFLQFILIFNTNTFSLFWTNTKKQLGIQKSKLLK